MTYCLLVNTEYERRESEPDAVERVLEEYRGNGRSAMVVFSAESEPEYEEKLRAEQDRFRKKIGVPWTAFTMTGVDRLREAHPDGGPFYSDKVAKARHERLNTVSRASACLDSARALNGYLDGLLNTLGGGGSDSALA